MTAQKPILVAMSGGVDSSTAAALLKAQECEAIGVTLKLANPGSPGEGRRGCCGVAGADVARRAASVIGIPFYALDYVEFFEETVVDYFCRAYLAGRTPNPCVECNRAVKFGRLLDFADSLGAAGVATGHYARLCRDRRTGRYLLKKGLDAAKDQSYFLYSLSQEQLSRAMFPLGEMTKEETRKRAKSFGLAVHDRPASQDVCFVADGDYRRFLAERFSESLQPGPIVNTRGDVLGEHSGVAFYTVGQRKGLGIAAAEALYVLAVQPALRTVVVGARKELMLSRLRVTNMNWIAFERPEGPLNVTVKVRYRQPEVPALVAPDGDGCAEVAFQAPQAAVASGQSAVFYDGDTVLGGGIVE